MTEVRVIFFLFDDFNFLCMVLRVWVVIETAVSGFSHPIVTSFQLIVEIFVILFFG